MGDDKTARLNALMEQIESLGIGSPEYHDAVAMLLTVMARRQWIIADSIRRSRADSAARQERARRRKVSPTA